MNKQILVLEDDQAIGILMKEVLMDMNYKVTLSQTTEAFEKNLKKTSPDLILMDVTIDGERVDHLAKKVKKDASMQDVPLVLISGVHDLEDIVQKTGADGAFSKPFDISELESYIQKKLA